MPPSPRNKLYGLSEKGLSNLSEDHRQGQQRRQNTRREGSLSADVDAFYSEPSPPGCYIAFTPTAGIPALDSHTTGTANDDEPGSAVCDIYRIHQQSGGLDATGTDTDGGTGTGEADKIPILHPVANLNRRVYNLSDCDIPGDTWIPIVRDNYGSWLAVSAADCLGGSEDCDDPGWDECYKRLVDVRVECVAGEIVTEIDVEYVRRCHGDLFSVSDTPCPVAPCTECSDGSPGDTLELVVSGISGTSGCTNANGTFSLTRTPGCEWESADFTIGADTGFHWKVFYNGPPDNNWRVFLLASDNTTSILEYEVSGAEDCSLSVTLTKTLEDGGCAGPDTIILRDPLVPSGCTSCDTDPGAVLHLTAGTVADGTCSPCSAASGTFTMNTTVPCQWESNSFTVCGESAQWVVNFNGVVWFCGVVGSSTPLFLEYVTSSVDCVMPITFTLFNNNGCDGPATITLSF